MLMDKNGQTALHYIAKYGREPVLRTFIKSAHRIDKKMKKEKEVFDLYLNYRIQPSTNRPPDKP